MLYSILQLKKLHLKTNNSNAASKVVSHFPILLTVIFPSFNANIHYHHREYILYYFHSATFCTNHTVIYDTLFDLLSYFPHFSDNLERILDFKGVFLISQKPLINELINFGFDLIYFIFRGFKNFLLESSILLIIESVVDFVEMIIYFIGDG